MAKSNRKPELKKPRPDFPLFPHKGTNRWAKKVRGKLVYFGRVLPDDPKGEKALKLWLSQKDDLLAGRKPRAIAGEGRLTIAELCNRYLAAKMNRLTAGELSPATFADCKETTDRIVRVFGRGRAVEDLGADDFQELRQDIAKTRNPESVGNEVNRARGVFKWAWDNRLIQAPVTYGTEFARPNRRILRAVRNSRPEKFFEATEIRSMLDAASVPLRAMLYLAVNCGYGNSDVGKLTLGALDLDAGVVEFPRPKTEIRRRCPLWPETIAALQEWLAVRPAPRDERHAGLVFITAHGHPWAKDPSDIDTANGLDDVHKQCRKSADNPISKEMRKLLNRLEIKRRGVSFYSLRHVFETIGGESRDQAAVDFIMGHSRDDMASHYRERISDDRLQAVVETVRRWLFPAAE